MDDRWKPGLPPGGFTQQMLDDFEVYYSQGGVIWHRRRRTRTGLEDQAEVAAIENTINRHMGGDASVQEIIAIMLERGWRPPA